MLPMLSIENAGPVFRARQRRGATADEHRVLSLESSRSSPFLPPASLTRVRLRVSLFVTPPVSAAPPSSITMAEDDLDEFAYFLPRGIEDFDADENLAAYERDQQQRDTERLHAHSGHGGSAQRSAARQESNDDGGGATPQQASTNASASSAGASSRSGSYSSSGSGSSSYVSGAPPLSTTWQASATQPVYTSAAQQAALRSVLEQTQRARLLQAQQQQSGYGSSGAGQNSSTDAILAAYYAQTSNGNGAHSASSSYYPTPASSPSPSHANSTVGGVGATGSNGATPGTSPSPDPNSNLTQMQFFQQLQLYQQALLLQQQHQQTMGGGAGGATPSHYTALPAYSKPSAAGMNIATTDEPRDEQLGEVLSGARAAGTLNPAAGPQAAGRRRPLPHNAHGQSLMQRPPAMEPASSPVAAPVQPPKATATTTTTTPVVATTPTAPVPAPSPPTAPVPTGSWASGNSTVLAANATPQAHGSSFDPHSKSTPYTKTIPSSVIASTKKENWPKVTTVAATTAVAAPVAAAATATAKKPEVSQAATTEKKPTKEEARKAAQAAAAAAKAASAAAASSSAKHKQQPQPTPAQRPAPAVTIRHIESEEPVPLTAVELSTLPAHHRKNEGKIISSIPAPNSIPLPAVTPSAAVAPPVAVIPKHRHDKFVLPGPPVIQNDNEFDLLADADPDALSLVMSKADRKKQKKAGKKGMKPGPEPEPEEEAPAEPEATAEEKLVESAEEEPAQDAEEADDAETEEAEAAAEADDDEEEDEADAAAEEDQEDEEEAAASSDDSDSEPPRAPVIVATSPSRTPSPAMAVSPTTGLPVAPILRGASAPANHTRRVSFFQPPTKKQLAAQRAREQPWLANQWKEQQEKQAAGSAPSSSAIDSASAVPAPAAEKDAEHDSSASYPVETVSGLKKRGGKKKGAKAAPPPPQPLKPKEESESDSDLDEAPATVVSTPITSPLKPSLPLLQYCLALWTAFLLQYRSIRGKSSMQSFVGVGSYLAGVLLGLVWSLLCLVARVHRHAASVLSGDHHLAFCFSFLYLFPYLVSHMTYWAPPWAAPCLWYAFLMQVFCTQGAAWMVTLARVVLPLLFLTEGVSHHTLLLELNGGERLLAASALAAFKTQEYTRPIFLGSLALQILTSLTYGQHVWIQWGMIVGTLMVIHEQEGEGVGGSGGGMTKDVGSSKSKAAALHPATPGALAGIHGPSGGGDLGLSLDLMSGATSGLLGALGGAFNRRTRAKAVAQKARRTGRF